MKRRHFLRNSGMLLGSSFLASEGLFAHMLQQPAWKITPLRNNISIFTEKGGTIAFYPSSEGYVVVDAQFPEQSQHLIDELKRQNDKPFRLLVNTHHHGDHTSGNISFKGIVAHVVAHANSLENQRNVAVKQNTADKQLYPDQTYTETWCEKIGDEQLCLYYYGAAHTNGDSLVHFQNANIVHVGDLMFNRRHPFVDRSAGASAKNWVTVLDKTTKKFDNKTLYVFGHAADGYPVTGTADDLKQFGEYLTKVWQFVEGEVKAGKTKEEILKTTTLPFDSQWKGDGLERPLTAIYDELTAPK